MTHSVRSAGFRLQILLAIASLLVVSAAEAAGRRVSANLVFWDQVRGFEAISANADILTEVSPFWYRLLPDGRVEPYRTWNGGTYEDAQIVAFLQQRGILVLPTVANVHEGQWYGETVSRILSDPQLAAANIQALVELTLSRGYDGIDLDYEDLKAADRGPFSAFVAALAEALHAHGKRLSVNVYAKTSEPGFWDGPQSQDWRVIGQHADFVRIMAYDYHWSTSAPGPIAPVDWIKDVLAFARTVVPREKITHGLPLYGYDWAGTAGTPVVWQQAAQLAQQSGAAVRWDVRSAAPWFEYLLNGQPRTVWFENAESFDAKFQYVRAHDAGGIMLWRLGGEDPEVWSILRADARTQDEGAAAAAASPAPPTRGRSNRPR